MRPASFVVVAAFASSAQTTTTTFALAAPKAPCPRSPPASSPSRRLRPEGKGEVGERVGPLPSTDVPWLVPSLHSNYTPFYLRCAHWKKGTLEEDLF